jgi:hypothetical protein
MAATTNPKVYSGRIYGMPDGGAPAVFFLRFSYSVKVGFT